MWNIFANNFINFFDYFYKKKIYNFLKKNNVNNFNIFFDVGAHRGESIKSYAKTFKVDEVYSFEPSQINFDQLQINSIKYKNKYKIKKIVIENFALGSSKTLGVFNQSKESSSSTFKNINQKSKYFKKKRLFFNIKEKYFDKTYKVSIDTLDNYINEKRILKIDFLKIDTEGYEYEVLNGLKNNFNKVKMIFLEHHYDNMIEKGYKFADINNLLIKNNFKKIFKCKMPFRKTFEYLYQNRFSN
tara:strand:+ start:226 stop:954 length:729 start_codon:yes stop_codon:yes gene_type:complete